MSSSPKASALNRYRQPVVVPEGINPEDISYLCSTDDPENCKRCSGRVMVKRAMAGRARYKKCACPRCEHPEPRTVRMRHQRRSNPGGDAIGK